ncbi:MAG: NUDIX domain-containing protein [Alphaproteobacteria bacterium]|nr:NUDIX domain-containing protein [Alphaproteobacteria bacterium]
MSSTPRPASTVVLLRDSSAGPEVFMVKRSAKSAFMPHVYVFPGGRVDPDDAAVPAQGGADNRDRMGISDADAYMIAAIRETLEEAGVLLARGPLDPGDRDAVRLGERPFAALARARDWILDLDRLVYWAWWITPEVEPRRYDTRFFVASVPRGVDAIHDDHEVVDSAWWTLDEVLARFDAGALNLAPPTWITLHELSTFTRVEDALAAGRQRRPPAIMPRAKLNEDHSVSILLPGDPEHPSDTPVEGPTRLTLRAGRWFVHR